MITELTVIRHILLLHPSGIPLFTTSFEKGIDCCSQEHKNHSAMVEKSTLFSSFLTSVNALANEFGGRLRHMKLGQWDVFVESREELTGVLLTTPSDDHSVHDNYTFALSDFISQFLELYKSDLVTWNGEITKFESFASVVNNHKSISIDVANVDICTSCIETVSSAIESLETMTE